MEKTKSRCENIFTSKHEHDLVQFTYNSVWGKILELNSFKN